MQNQPAPFVTVSQFASRDCTGFENNEFKVANSTYRWTAMPGDCHGSRLDLTSCSYFDSRVYTTETNCVKSVKWEISRGGGFNQTKEISRKGSSERETEREGGKLFTIALNTSV